MTTASVLKFTLTKVGLRAVFNAQNNGLEAKISHIALGDANQSAQTGHGYSPDINQTALHNEKVRQAIGGGERIGDFEIHMAALFDDASAFWIWEAGVFLDDGTLLGVWSDLETPWQYKNASVPTVMAVNLTIQALPPDSINITITGPSVNITIIAPFAQITRSLIRTQTQIIANDVKRLIPTIENTWS